MRRVTICAYCSNHSLEALTRDLSLTDVSGFRELVTTGDDP